MIVRQTSDKKCSSKSLRFSFIGPGRLAWLYFQRLRNVAELSVKYLTILSLCSLRWNPVPRRALSTSEFASAEVPEVPKLLARNAINARAPSNIIKGRDWTRVVNNFPSFVFRDPTNSRLLEKQRVYEFFGLVINSQCSSQRSLKDELPRHCSHAVGSSNDRSWVSRTRFKIVFI